MHKEVLNKNQIKLIPMLKAFKDKYYLVGGTAIALHLGHRESIDFDLFTDQNIDHEGIKRIIRSGYNIESVLVENSDELTLIVNNVKVTFLNYPFSIEKENVFEKDIFVPSLDTLLAMKSYAIGRRAKWKDYVDLYFYLKNNDFIKLVKITKDIFKNEFNEKLFREQLTYFEDIDYSENIKYIAKEVPTDKDIKNFLLKTALTFS